MLNLFDKELCCFYIEELCSGDFSFFKKGLLLNYESKDTINIFFTKLYNTWDIIPFYHCIPEINSITGESKYRFMIIKIDDDEVFFAYKVIQILTTKQIRVFDKVVSKNGNIENEIIVTRELEKKPFIKFAFLKNAAPLINNIDQAHKLVEYNNYYYTRESFFSSVTNQKLRKWGCNLFLKNTGYVVSTRLSRNNDGEIIRKLFNEYLIFNGHKINSKDDKEYKNIVFSDSDNIKIIAIYKDGNIISLTVLYVINEMKVAYMLYNMQIKKEQISNDDGLKKFLSHNMTERIKYAIFSTYQDIDTIFILGCRPTERRLIKYKEEISDGKIEYYIK